MAEKSNRLRIVGGRDYKPDAEKAEAEKVEAEKTEAEKVSDGDLIRLWDKRMHEKPANLDEQVIQTLFNDAAKELQGCTKGQLYAFLLNDNLWQSPSFALALLQEVQRRLHSGLREPGE